MAVYFYFLVALLVRQATFEKGNENIYQAFTPIFLIMEFLFYFGWLNVASTLYNPFGDDDEDFDLTSLMNRHIRVCMSIVEDDNDTIPKVQDDTFWHSPESTSEGWHPTILVKPSEYNRFSLRRLVSRRQVSGVGSGMQTECRDMGVMGSIKSWQRTSTERNRDYKSEEEPELPEVVVEEAQQSHINSTT